MITHTVLFKFHDTHRAHLAQARDGFAALVGQVPQIRELSVGVNVVESARAYDLCLIITFDSLDDLAGYQSHPAHQVVARQVNTWSDSVLSVDFES